MAIGANQEDSNSVGIDGNQADNSVSNAGAVYVFERDGMNVWMQQAYVKASNPGATDFFGLRQSLQHRHSRHFWGECGAVGRCQYFGCRSSGRRQQCGGHRGQPGRQLRRRRRSRLSLLTPSQAVAGFHASVVIRWAIAEVNRHRATRGVSGSLKPSHGGTSAHRDLSLGSSTQNHQSCISCWVPAKLSSVSPARAQPAPPPTGRGVRRHGRGTRDSRRVDRARRRERRARPAALAHHRSRARACVPCHVDREESSEFVPRWSRG
jgi:hypothetical protein